MNTSFEIEYYYKSQQPDHLQLLRIVEQTVAKARRGGLAVTLRLINCDDPTASWPERVIAIPCVRRVLPGPERLIVGSLGTREEVEQAIGFPQSRLNRCAEGLDIFRGLPGEMETSNKSNQQPKVDL